MNYFKQSRKKFFFSHDFFREELEELIKMTQSWTANTKAPPPPPPKRSNIPFLSSSSVNHGKSEDEENVNNEPHRSSPLVRELTKVESTREIKAAAMTGKFSLRESAKSSGSIRFNIGTLRGAKGTFRGFGTTDVSNIVKAASMTPDSLSYLSTPVFVSFSKRNLMQELTLGKSSNVEENPVLVTVEEIPEFNFATFANNNFQTQVKGKLMKTTVSSLDMLLFSKKKMNKSLLSLTPEETKVALEVWDCILGFMGLSSSASKEGTILRNL
jgi:hypothetical protein